MDSFEWNKIIGAVLGSLIFIFVIKTVAEIVYEPEVPAKAGYIVEGVVEEGAGGATAEKPEEMPDWGTVLASADVAAGKSISGRCLQCHTLNKGEPNKIGPNIYGIVNDARGEVSVACPAHEFIPCPRDDRSSDRQRVDDPRNRGSIRSKPGEDSRADV